MAGTTIVALGDSTTAGTPGFKSPLEAPPDGAGNVQSADAREGITAFLQKRTAKFKGQ